MKWHGALLGIANFWICLRPKDFKRSSPAVSVLNVLRFVSGSCYTFKIEMFLKQKKISYFVILIYAFFFCIYIRSNTKRMYYFREFENKRVVVQY